MRTVVVNIPEDLYDFIQGLIDKEIFPNRSEFLRAAIRELLVKHACFSD